MAEPHTSSNPGNPHGAADQPPLPHGQTADRQAASAASGEQRIASLSSQLKGLNASLGERPNEPQTTTAASNPAANSAGSSAPHTPVPENIGREDDWGIAPTKSGLSRETKMGFAFVLVLLGVFSFVVYKKIEHRKAAEGDLLAGTESLAEPGTTQTPAGDPPAATRDLNTSNPFETPSESSTVSTVSWNQESPENNAYQPQPTPATSIDQFPTEQETFSASSSSEFSPPTALDQNTQPFAPTPESEQFAATTNTQEFAPPEAFDPAQPFPATGVSETGSPVTEVGTSQPFSPAESATSDQFAEAPVGFEPPTQFGTTGQSVPLEPTPEPAAPGNPFAASPDFSQPGTTVPQPAPEGQFSPTPVAETPAASGNPFGPFGSEPGPTPVDVPRTQPPVTELIPEQEFVESSFPTEATPAGTDPFPTASIPGQPTEAFSPVDMTPEQTLPAAAPSEFAPPNQLPIAQNNAIPVPTGDFSPASLESEAPTEFQPVPKAEGLFPQPVPGESFAQNSNPSFDNTVQFPGATASSESTSVGGNVDVYTVRPGDNYWKISKNQYGTVRYFSALERYNKERIPDPKKMRPGMKVLTPSRETLEAQNPDLFPKFASNTNGIANAGHQNQPSGFFVEGNGTPMYRVGQNDTLGGISQKHLGRFSRWVEIYRMNRHRLKDPNALTVGDVLQLPADASRVNMVRQASGIR